MDMRSSSEFPTCAHTCISLLEDKHDIYIYYYIIYVDRYLYIYTYMCFKIYKTFDIFKNKPDIYARFVYILMKHFLPRSQQCKHLQFLHCFGCRQHAFEHGS